MTNIFSESSTESGNEKEQRKSQNFEKVEKSLWKYHGGLIASH